MRSYQSVGLILFMASCLASPTAADARGVLDAVRAHGVLRCGVSEGILGFSAKDASGRWQGLDVDFCRAVAAAVLGDADKVKFVPLRSFERFPALQGKQVDLLVRNTTWTLTREAVLRVQFPGVLFHDGQGFMVPVDSGITHLDQLREATLCVERGTNHGRNLARYAARSGVKLTPLVLGSADEVAAAFFAGRCAAYTSDASQLAAARLSAPGGAERYLILPERISREPLAPVVWGGDPEWTTVVRWVLFVLLIAEEDSVTQANVEAKAQAGEGQLDWINSEEKKLLGQALGLEPGWAQRAIRAVGNYGEIYERNVGAGSPLKIERGPNRLWTQGGLLFAPPID